MIRAVLHLAREAAWTLVFKLAERRFPPDEPQPFDDAARVRTRWMAKRQRNPHLPPPYHPGDLP